MKFYKNEYNEGFVLPDSTLENMDKFIEISESDFNKLVELSNPPPPTDEELKYIKLNQFEKEVQNHLDTTAKSKGYESILSACTYAGYTNPFQTEGQAFTEWRGNVWAYCYTQIDIFTGTIDEFIAILPKFEG